MHSRPGRPPGHRHPARPGPARLHAGHAGADGLVARATPSSPATPSTGFTFDGFAQLRQAVRTTRPAADGAVVHRSSTPSSSPPARCCSGTCWRCSTCSCCASRPASSAPWCSSRSCCRRSRWRCCSRSCSQSPRRTAWSTSRSSARRHPTTIDWFGSGGRLVPRHRRHGHLALHGLLRRAALRGAARHPRGDRWSPPASTAPRDWRLVRHIVAAAVAAGAGVVAHLQHQRHPQGLRLRSSP